MDTNEMQYRLTVAAYARHLGKVVPDGAYASDIKVQSETVPGECRTCDEAHMVNYLTFCPAVTQTHEDVSWEESVGLHIMLDPFSLADFTRFVTNQPAGR